jgi:hypothetical protein
MTTITFPSNTKDTIDDIRAAIGREITITNITSVSGCAVCSLDPINNSSTDPFCPVCSGFYWITTTSGINVIGHVHWGPTEIVSAKTGGKIYQGDCTVTIEYTAALDALVKSAEHFTVDGVNMSLDKLEYRGKRDINRIRLVLKEEEK